MPGEASRLLAPVSRKGRERIAKLAAVVLAAVVLVGCGTDDNEGEPGEPATEAEEPAVDLPDGELSLAEVRRARGAVRVIERQAANVAGARLSEPDLLPARDGAELLVEEGYIDGDRFCAAIDTVVEIDPRETDADLPAAAERFGSVWQEAAPDDVAHLGGSIFDGLFDYCR
jgi:hypothetical protein